MKKRELVPTLIEHSIWYVNYREGKFDIRDFDHIKDLCRMVGFTSVNVSLLCGERQYCQLENIMTNTWTYKEAQPPKGVRVFQKNGIFWWVHLVEGMYPWGMIISPGRLTDPMIINNPHEKVV